MNGIEKQAAFYRGYLTDEKSLVPLTILLTASVALWLLVYLVGAVTDARQGGGAARVASELHRKHVPRIEQVSPIEARQATNSWRGNAAATKANQSDVRV